MIESFAHVAAIGTSYEFSKLYGYYHTITVHFSSADGHKNKMIVLAAPTSPFPPMYTSRCMRLRLRPMAISTGFYNVVMHGIAFMALFTAFQTSSGVRPTWHNPSSHTARACRVRKHHPEE